MFLLHISDFFFLECLFVFCPLVQILPGLSGVAYLLASLKNFPWMCCRHWWAFLYFHSSNSLGACNSFGQLVLGHMREISRIHAASFNRPRPFSALTPDVLSGHSQSTLQLAPSITHHQQVKWNLLATHTLWKCVRWTRMQNPDQKLARCAAVVFVFLF